MVSLMIRNVFKKRVSILDATAVYIGQTASKIRESWESDIQGLNSLYDETIIDSKDDGIQYEFFIAFLSLELQAVKNIAPKKHRDIVNSIMFHLNDNDPYEGQSIEVFKEYLYYIEHAEVHNVLLHEVPVSVFAKRIGLEGAIVRMAILEIMVKKLGLWKTILKNYNIK